MGFLRTLIVLWCCFLSVVAQAETIPATTESGFKCDGPGNWGLGTTKEATCYDWAAKNPYGPATYNAGDNTCRDSSNGVLCFPSASQIQTCPMGQNWTLSGSTCSRPDCVAPQVRQTDGTCGAPAECPSSGSSYGGEGLYNLGPSGATSYCSSNGCLVMFQGTWPTHKTSSGQLLGTGSLVYTGGGPQGACTPSPSMPTVGTGGQSSTKPPCASGEGVLTSSSGTVACVPPGIPSSSTPIVQKGAVTDTKPDGTKVVSETITVRDPKTGAEDTTTTIRTFPPGCTGVECSSTSTSSSTKNATTGQPSGGGTAGGNDQSGSDFCAKNPNLQICKGGMNEEATQKKVKESLETAFNTDGVTNDEITNKTVSESKKQEAEDAFDAIKTKLTSGSDASDKQAQFSDALSTWFEPIPSGSCSPLTSTVGGRTFTLDPCPTAEKVASLAAYALWIYLAFGSLALITRKAE